MSEPEIRSLVVGEEGTGQRLDTWVSAQLGLSRTRVASLVAEGAVLWNDAVPRKSEPLSSGDRIEVRIPDPRPIGAEPEEIDIEILFEDSDIAVVNKPAGLVVHPAPGHPTGTLVNALLFRIGDLSGIGGTLRPGIVHRLDRDTSGLMVVAKNDMAHRSLASALKARRVRRLYVAAAWGHLRESHVRVDQPIGRDPRARKKMAVVEGGRRAVTHLRVRERWRAADLLDAGLETGRTHQIRVHLAHLGHPVLGDDTYGGGWERGMSGTNQSWAAELARRVPRQFLHAERLAFEHPRTGERVSYRAPLPSDLSAVAEWARDG